MRDIIRWLISSCHLKSTIIAGRLDYSLLLMMRDLKIQRGGLADSKRWILIISQLNVIFLVLIIVSILLLLSWKVCICKRNVDKLLALKNILELKVISISISGGGISTLFDVFSLNMISVDHGSWSHWGALIRLH